MDDLNIIEISNPVDPIDLSVFKEHIEETLISIISSLPKIEKNLIIDKSLVSNINFFTSVSKLEKENVKKEIKILSNDMINLNTQIEIYIIPPKKESLILIENHIKNYSKNIEESKKQNKIILPKEFHLIFIPKINNDCNDYIMNSYYFEIYTFIHNLGIDIYPLDYDLMSLEEDNIIKEIYIDKNFNVLQTLCKSYLKFETVFGKIKNKYYIGENAFKLNNLIKKEELNYSFENESNFICSIIFDRNIDFITPLCTVNTYEGLLDEHFGIKFNQIKVESTFFVRKEKKDFIKIDLSNKNKFYTMIKDYNFIRLNLFLHRKIRYFKNLINEGKEIKELSKVSENLMKVKKMNEEKPYLEDNITLSGIISEKLNNPIYKLYFKNEQNILSLNPPKILNEFYENEIYKKNPPFNILKLFCLESLTQNGIKSKNYDNFKKDFFQIYGFEHLILWNNLEKLKILKKYDKYSNFNFEKISNELNLIIENINLLEADDASYPYNGYCPIIIRLIEKGIKNGFSKIKDMINMLSDINFFGLDDKVLLKNKEKKFILLIFIGGITYGEIASIRYLNETLQFYKFVILTTNIINIKKIFDEISIQQ
jgi:hypothetical protein